MQAPVHCRWRWLQRRSRVQRSDLIRIFVTDSSTWWGKGGRQVIACVVWHMVFIRPGLGLSRSSSGDGGWSSHVQCHGGWRIGWHCRSFTGLGAALSVGSNHSGGIDRNAQCPPPPTPPTDQGPDLNGAWCLPLHPRWQAELPFFPIGFRGCRSHPVPWAFQEGSPLFSFYSKSVRSSCYMLYMRRVGNGHCPPSCGIDWLPSLLLEGCLEEKCQKEEGGWDDLIEM